MKVFKIKILPENDLILIYKNNKLINFYFEAVDNNNLDIIMDYFKPDLNFIKFIKNKKFNTDLIYSYLNLK